MAAKGDFSSAISMLDENISRDQESVSLRLAKLKLELRNKKDDELSGQIDEIASLMKGL